MSLPSQKEKLFNLHPLSFPMTLLRRVLVALLFHPLQFLIC